MYMNLNLNLNEVQSFRFAVAVVWTYIKKVILFLKRIQKKFLVIDHLQAPAVVSATGTFVYLSALYLLKFLQDEVKKAQNDLLHVLY